MDAALQNRLASIHDRTTELLDVILPRDRQGKGWICPFCGNGRGTTGDGIIPTPRRPDLLICFRCGKKMDALDIAGEVYGISSFADRLAKCEELAGDNCGITRRPPSTRPAQQKKQLKTDYTKFFREARKHIGETDYLQGRGISDAVAQDERFFLGFAPFHLTGKDRNGIVFPTSKHSFTVRIIDPKAEHGNRYRNRGEIAPFASGTMYMGRPCFVTEGAINALSIFEAGGVALALGSTEGITAFLNRIDQKRPTAPLLLALDNDEAGELATVKLCKALDNRTIRYSCVSLCRPGMDINDELRTDRTRLMTLVHDAERRIT